MSPVRLQDGVSSWRAWAFPFFDRIEIAFTLAILALEVIGVLVFDIRSGWAIPVGSYCGMAAVAWTVLPSTVSLDKEELLKLPNTLCSLGMERITANVFCPPLPFFLRWPRNVVVIHDSTLSLSGPRSLLEHIRSIAVTLR